MSDKPFLTYEAQIAKLKSKGLGITDYDFAINLLKENSYYALISGYKKPFKKKDGTYILHSDIKDIYSLYLFDNELRALFLKYILRIENHVKSLISYSFCQTYGDDQQTYLNATHYNYSAANQEEVNKLISRLTKIVSNPSQYPYIKYQKNAHKNIPLWVLLKALTIGTVSKMYSFLPQKIQQSVSKEFEYVNEGELVQMIDILSRFRNVCAHNERLYDYQYNKGTIDNTDIHRILNLRIKKGQYAQGKKDLFAVVIVFKYLLSSEDFDKFMNSLEQIMDNLFSSTKCLQKSLLLKSMGFPDNWKEIRYCSKFGITD